MKPKFTELDYQVEAINKTIKAITIWPDRREFAVEMETGTGKTYTYIRTIFETYKKLKISKFVIVAPSVAVREGIRKSFENLKEHLQEKYPDVFYDVYNYSSKKLRDIDNFSSKETLQILVIGIHSFNKDSNILKQNCDGLSGGLFESEKYFDKISATKPVVIIDEPQMMDAEKSKESINSLSPRFVLKYSATHKNLKYHPVYTLSPNDAYQKRLVKQIEYLGIYIKDQLLTSIKLARPAQPQGKKWIGFILENGKERKVKDGDKIGNLRIEKILPNDILFDSGKLSEMSFVETDEFLLRRDQISQTIQIHEQKKKRLNQQGIKVLSLFFIDSVQNFERLKSIFESELKKICKTDEIADKYAFYFSDKSTAKGIENDEEKLRQIVEEKEKLLTFDDEKLGKVEYVFTHSALGVGWDCPNIFQICFLRDIGSDISRRQFIGRGLRICVNQNGDRVKDNQETPKDEIVNLLTVIASENWQDFVKNYQADAKKEGYEVPNPSNAEDRLKATKSLKIRKEKLSEAKLLWQKISQKSKYLIRFSNRNQLYENIIAAIKGFEGEISGRKISIEKADFGTAFEASLQDADYGTNLEPQSFNKEEIIEKICEETWLTKWELQQILQKCDESTIAKNPDFWRARAISEIKKAINDELLAIGRVSIKYQINPKETWPESAFYDEEKQTTSDVEPAEKSLYELVEYDSRPERNFIKTINKTDKIKLFMKLPKGGEQKFHINTPIGKYYPDFAVVIENGGKLYMVFEVKDRASFNLKSKEEEFKIACAIQHFRALGFDVETKNIETISELVALKNNSYSTVNSSNWE